jgi:hypothetical protein
MGIPDEKIGDPRQHLAALRIVAGGKRSFEFVEQGWRGRHGPDWRRFSGTNPHHGRE